MIHQEMNCPLLFERDMDVLLDYAAGRLDRTHAVQLELHMESCEGCAAFRVEQTALWSVLDQWEPQPVSLDFNRRLWQRIDQIAAAPWYRRLVDAFQLGTWKPAIPLAAAVLVVATAFMMDHPANMPVAPGVAASEDASSLEVDQVERTLDDVQLLKQFDSTVTQAAASKTM